MKKYIITLLVCFTTLVCKSQCTTADPCFYENITATTAYLGQNGSVKITVDDAYNDNEITHPLIVVEGFDLGVVIEPEKEFGSYDYDNFRDFVEDSFSNDLRNLIWSSSGKDYDIIYVDWNNGVDYLQRNAYALEAVIQWVNSIKLGTEQNVVLGQSMGGVIARWALAVMEERSISHDTRLFVSQDAPQQGANIPASLQYMYRHGGNQYVQTGQTLGGVTITIPLLESKVGVSNYLSLLDTPATKQLLKNTSTSSYTMVNTDHDTFYNGLKNKGLSGSNGYPLNCRNVALSNGSECGNIQDFSAGDHLVNFQYNKGLSFWGDLLSLIYNPLGGVIGGTFVDNDLFGVALLGLVPGHSKYNVDFQAKAIPYGTGNQIYKGVISYTKKVLWLFNVTVNITNVQKNQPSGVLPFDNYGGGFYNVNNINTNNLPSGVFIRNKFSFIPTASALDIGENNVNLNDSDYLKSYVGKNPPSAPKNSPFDNYSTEFDKVNPNAGNYSHISFNTRNGDWLAAELVGTNILFSDCSFVCENAEITGAGTLCNSGTYSVAGGLPFYSWSVTEGGSLVTLSGNGTPNVTLMKNGSNSGYVTLQVDLGDNGQTCGNATLTKRIFVGAPSVNIVRTFEWCEGKYHYLTLLANTNDDNGTVSWNYFPPFGSNFYENGNTLEIQLNKTFQGYLDVFANVSNTCGSSGASFDGYIKKCGTFTNQPPFNAMLSPNPTANEMNVTIEMTETEDNHVAKNESAESLELHYEIYDVYGNKLYSKKHQQKRVKINTERFKEGFYILLLTNGEDKVSKSFVVKR